MNDKNPAYNQAAADYFHAHVHINYARINELEKPAEVGAMGAILQGTPMAGRPLLFTAFLIAMDVLNYQFWDLAADGSMVRYSHNGKVGALAMQSVFIDCWSKYIPAEGPDNLAVACAVRGMKAELEMHDLQGLFGDIPAASSRLELLEEVLNAERLLSAATYLVARVENEDQLGWGDAALLAYLFPKCYEDQYLKKAQLTLMFIAAEWRAMNCGRQVALDVSAAADYQLPKVLRALGVLEYSTYVASLVDQERTIEANSDIERAIRAATLHACDALATQFGVSIEAVDFWLWQQRNVAKTDKFHLTRTTSY